ncbi:helix-turn-helix domain-containing protein [Chitinimonas lacunae]|uniref:Helix-turn-helix domain-containing protein n=1 Tax=Chitinimonas lacunae TaxID=1963018 RepID=A0ABV8ML42_9NEIS
MPQPRLVISDAVPMDELETAARHEPEGRVRSRLLAIRHLRLGHNVLETAGLFGLEKSQLRAWIHRYNAEGLPGLRDRTRSGAPPKLNAEQEAGLRQCIKDGPPPSLGISCWTGNTLRAWLRETYGISYSSSGLYALLHRLGLTAQVQRPHLRERLDGKKSLRG